MSGYVRMSPCWNECLTAAGRRTSDGVSRSAGTDRVCPVRRWEHQREVGSQRGKQSWYCWLGGGDDKQLNSINLFSL